MSLLDYAKQAMLAGLCVMPPREDGSKAPVESWKASQIQLSTEAQLKEWYSKKKYAGIGYVTGKVSGNLEVMDFDIADYYHKYMDALENADPDLAERFMSSVESTPKGFHVYYRCSTIAKNLKLATVNGKTAIETRGEGGYIVAAPSNGKVNPAGRYELVSGGVNTIPTFTPEERSYLHQIARECFDDAPTPECIVTYIPKGKNVSQGKSLLPGDDFNARHPIEEVIQRFGWTFRRHRRDGTAEWTRPGSTSHECHATTNHNGIPFYVFSTNAAPLEAGRGYDAFAVYTYYEHGKDQWSEAASELSGKGYGEHTPAPTEAPAWLNKSKGTGIKMQKLMRMELPPMKWIVSGLLPEGCTILAGAPKIGKSWLALDMALSISTPDRKLFGEYETPHGSVLYLALEDSLRRLQDRTKKIIEGLPTYHPQAAKATDQATVVIDWPPIGKGCMEHMEQFLTDNPDTRLIIIDTLQKVRPAIKGSPNAYEVDYNVISQFQTFALRHHLAIVLITHLRKSSSITKDTDEFEQVTGSMGLSGAADATIIFKRGKASDMADLYIRGRDVEEQLIRLKQINGVWFYFGNAEDSPAHLDEIREFVSETGKQQFQPADFNKWCKANGEEVKSVRVVFKRLYESGHIRKIRDGLFALM